MGADNARPNDAEPTASSGVAPGPGNEPMTVGPIIPLNVDGVPAELRELPNWVTWRVKPPSEPGAKFGKEPINPRTGGFASSTNPKTWGTFKQAGIHAAKHNLGGVGFMFSNSPYTGIDLDHCRDPETGEIADWAWEIIKRFDSYAEVSPSGKGVHVIVRAKLSGKGRRVGDIEIYDTARFFTITGRPVQEAPK